MSARFTKNCEVALLMSLVRAMESVPRRFFSPFCASLLIGARVRLFTKSAVNPPPWMTKPGTMR
ncbi:MAG: hypothetical protein AUH10_12885 [Gammaproteobacteria bacterium 13_2_20CM_66_19]|nr:MAG: hypothetical protein AUH10_12885 [Gammaproteobacteria bacterium 13_2_20CM_66_19]